MTVYVSFCQPGSIGSIHAPGVGAIRVRESLTIPASTTATFADGELAIVFNGESAPVFIAFGTTPDAAATAASAVTTAGVVVAAGGWLPIVGKAGDKINAKAIA
jgi:hypothetical protein